jgi:nucleoside-diphosphate-sugar epimerase
MTQTPCLLCFGFGFTASAVAQANPSWAVLGTRRETSQPPEFPNVNYLAYDGDNIPSWLDRVADQVSHILLSIPPFDKGDRVAQQMGAQLAKFPNLKWVGYLSTTGVYGDLNGGIANEDTPYNPSGIRGLRRVAAEQKWLKLLQDLDLPVHIFRLPGIYGPDRNQMVSLKAGKAHRIIKKRHMFSRIHVDDIAAILTASMLNPNPGRIYNVADDLPAPPQDVVAYAAQLLGMTPPPEQDFEIADLSAMARSFYADNKIVSNERIKQELGVVLRYPTYKVGLKALSETL